MIIFLNLNKNTSIGYEFTYSKHYNNIFHFIQRTSFKSSVEYSTINVYINLNYPSSISGYIKIHKEE